jgi:hypothetical protein
MTQLKGTKTPFLSPHLRQPQLPTRGARPFSSPPSLPPPPPSRGRDRATPRRATSRRPPLSYRDLLSNFVQFLAQDLGMT